MTDTMTEVKQPKQPPPPYLVGKMVCGFCLTNHHTPTEQNPTAQCVGAVLNSPEGVPQVYRCPCTCAGNRPRCFNCGARYDEEEAKTALTSMWTCTDVEGCQARISRRRKANPAIVLIDQFFEEREEMATKTATKRAAKKAAAKPTSGKCLCCDKATKGGKFLPGHDARYISQFVEAVISGNTTAAKAKGELRAQGVSPALLGKFDKGLAAAKAKAEASK